MEYILSKNYENDTLPYRKWKPIFDLCVEWHHSLLVDLNNIANIKEEYVGDKTIELSDKKGSCNYTYSKTADGRNIKVISDFSFNTYTKNRITLLCQKIKNKQTINENDSILSNILNLMERLNKIK